MNIQVAVIVSVSVSVLAFLVALYFFFWVKKQPSSNPEIARVGGFIKKGANTFLKKEYMLLAIFAGVAAVLILLFLPHPIWGEETAKWSWVKNVSMMISYI
ncbi:sodium-translocating pyrophosphatase, partial [Candidatus Saccharibacteria bacterium]|nr:sodium-translocating pyrophosphatase [Candidatus Saccharibacteria bacterium]